MIRPARRVYDFAAVEREVQEWWRSAGVYEQVKERGRGRPRWLFLDGPPYASGAIHLGTAWNKIIKDALLRFMTMRGFDVSRQPGWDCHGLPIEVKVEELLGIRSKKEIETRIGVAEFIRRCRQWALEHVSIMTDQFRRLGVWMDWDRPYMTLTNDYIEKAWWTFKRAYESGLVGKDVRVIHWCPRCETALAEHEVRGEYEEVSDPSIYVRFRVKGREREYLLVWTTTPWTIPANVAVCVHPDFDYVRVEAGGEIYILAEGLLPKVAGELGFSDFRVIERLVGRELEGLEYEHPLLEEVPKQREFVCHHRVICGPHVTLEEGTGCVHTAPGHGEEDYEIGKVYGLPVFSPVGPDGRFTEEAGKYAGLFVKDADEVVERDLERKGLLLKKGRIVHSYPLCWRCHTPLIFRATEQWFIFIKNLKPRILERNERVEWIPQWVKTRYVNGVESVGDWCISRQRYWGIPIPMWVCRSCGRQIVIGSLEELRKRAAGQVPPGIDLHKPFVDEIELTCECGGLARRIPDVLDVWFDSGIAAWASATGPDWQRDFIVEGEDQVTKWFYSQQVLSVAVFDDVPYRRVLMHGFVLDEHGRKMSKSLGNVIEPEEVVEKAGADVLRLYILSVNPPWEDLKFSWRGVEQARRVLSVLWNVPVFATTYMSLDRFDPKAVDPSGLKLQLEDRWILSRVNSSAEEMTVPLDAFEIHRAARALSDFILEDLSRWYIRLVRERAWIEREDPAKTAMYWTLHRLLFILMRLLSPFAPHMAEVLYRDLVREADPSAQISVHMLDWPEPERGMIDGKLEEAMASVRRLVEAAARLRQEAGIKGRWPVRKIVVQPRSEISDLLEILRRQLNCKELEVLPPSSAFPDLPGFVSCETEAGRIALCTEMTDELKAEGLAREVVRRFQMMRKDLDLGMEERVDASIGVDGKEEFGMLVSMQDYIKREVRIRNLKICGFREVGGEGYLKDWDLDGLAVRLLIRRIQE